MSAASQETPVPFIDLVAQYKTIEQETQETVTRVFSEQRFILGDEVTLLEQEIAEYSQTTAAIGCGSGTDALILALMALNIGEGDEVITSPFTFFATASSIHRVGAKPVFVDIDPVTMNIDPAKIEAAITPQTKAIIPVHIFGQCADMTSINEIAEKHKLHVIEDAAQAIGAEHKGQRAGTMGTIGCLSFFPTKNLGGAGDGGMVITNNSEIADRIRQLRVHGQTSVYYHEEVGLNSRLDALQAAVLRVKLKALDSWTEGRQQNAHKYAQLFAHYNLLDQVALPEIGEEHRHVYNQYTIRVQDGKRDELLSNLRSRKIGAAVYYPVSLHEQPCFSYLGYQTGDLPESELASASVISLPIYAEIPVEHLETVVRGIAEFYAEGTLSTPHLFDSEQQQAA